MICYVPRTSKQPHISHSCILGVTCPNSEHCMGWWRGWEGFEASIQVLGPGKWPSRGSGERCDNLHVLGRVWILSGMKLREWISYCFNIHGVLLKSYVVHYFCTIPDEGNSDWSRLFLQGGCLQSWWVVLRSLRRNRIGTYIRNIEMKVDSYEFGYYETEPNLEVL